MLALTRPWNTAFAPRLASDLSPALSQAAAAAAGGEQVHAEPEAAAEEVEEDERNRAHWDCKEWCVVCCVLCVAGCAMRVANCKLWERGDSA